MVWTMATFIGFTILVAVISYVKTKGDDQSTADGYFLAGADCRALLSQVRCC